MKRKKIELKELKVKSFITNQKASHIKGGMSDCCSIFIDYQTGSPNISCITQPEDGSDCHSTGTGVGQTGIWTAIQINACID